MPIVLPCSGCCANSIQSNSISPKLFCSCLSSCSLSELGVGDKLSINPTYSHFNKELRQVFLAITPVSAEKVFHLFFK